MSDDLRDGEEVRPLAELMELGEQLRELPVATLHRSIDGADLHAALPLLAQLSSEQVQQLVDRQVWGDDGLDNDRLQQWTFALSKIDDAGIAKRHLGSIDMPLLAYQLKSCCLVFFEERGEAPPQPQGTFYRSPDGHFALDLLTEPGHETERVTAVLDFVYEHDPAHARRMLVDVAWEPPDRLEAEARRLRDQRSNVN